MNKQNLYFEAISRDSYGRCDLISRGYLCRETSLHRGVLRELNPITFNSRPSASRESLAHADTRSEITSVYTKEDLNFGAKRVVSSRFNPSRPFSSTLPLFYCAIQQQQQEQKHRWRRNPHSALL